MNLDRVRQVLAKSVRGEAFGSALVDYINRYAKFETDEDGDSSISADFADQVRAFTEGYTYEPERPLWVPWALDKDGLPVNPGVTDEEDSNA